MSGDSAKTELARQAVNRLMNQYCYLIDAGDMDGFARLFSHGQWGVVGEPGGPAAGAQAVAERLENVILYDDGTPRTAHVMTNQVIDIESDLYATARCYITVLQAVPPELPLQAIFAGRYDDVFECVDGQWRFASRDIHPTLLGNLAYHRTDMA